MNQRCNSGPNVAQKVNDTAEDFWPSGFVTVIRSVPIRSEDAVAFKDVLFIKMTLAGTLPILTVAPRRKRDPCSRMDVSPANAPVSRVTEVRIGAENNSFTRIASAMSRLSVLLRRTTL